MSHRHIACKDNQEHAKCDHIDCECITHLSDSSEHVICKWDPTDQASSQLSSLMGQDAYSTLSECIDTGGIRRSSVVAPSEQGKVEATAPGVRCQEVRQSQTTKKVTDKTSGQRDLDRLKSELSETQALLEKTEEQLLHQMDRNLDLEETTSQSTPRSLLDYHDSTYLASLQNIIGHLYLGKDDARRLLGTVKSRLEDLGTNIMPENYTLRSQLQDLQVVLQDVIRGKGQDMGHEVTSDLHSILTQSKNDEETSRSITIVENLMQKLNNKEDELHRWEVLVEQLNKELEQARLRCESNTNALYSKQEECRQQDEELRKAHVKVQKLERFVGAVRSKGNSQQGQARTTQTDVTPTSCQQTTEGALSALTAQLQQQQLTASELQLEREHNQRLQELRLGVTEAGNRWEKEVITLDLHVKQLTNQLQDAKKQSAHLDEDKKHQKKHLQEMRESITQLAQSHDKISAELKEVKEELAKANQRLAAAQTALTYERNSNENLKEQCGAASQTEVQLAQQVKESKETERQLSQQLADAQKSLSELRQHCSVLCTDLQQANDELQDRADNISGLQTEMEVVMTTSKAEKESEREAARCLRQDLEKTIEAGDDQITEMKKVMGRQEEDLKMLAQTRRKLQEQQSENKQLTETNNDLIAETNELHTAIDEQSEENSAIHKQSEAVKRDLEVALVRQKSCKEWGALQEEKMKEALMRWEEARTQLTNRVTELQVNLKENKTSMHQLNVTNHQNAAAKDRLQHRIETLQQQVHAKDVSLQTMLERLSNTQKDLREEKQAKDESERNLVMVKASLDKKESSLQTQNSKVCSLETMKTNLKDMTKTQKASITALQKQLKQQQKEFVGYKHQVETNMELLKERNETLAHDLQQQVTHLEEALDRSNKRNASLTADLQVMSASMEDKKTDHCKLLQSLHSAEQREGELKLAQQELTHQLQMEKQAQHTLKKRLEEQESEMKEFQHSMKEEYATDKSFRLEHLKESLDSTFRLEFNQLKAEITRQTTIKQAVPQTNKLSDHDKVLILQRELGKLRILHSADLVTIETLREDILMQRHKLEKQKALILSSSSQRVRKSDIQAALAKAQAKAFIMSPVKRPQAFNFDPGNRHQGFNFDPGNHYYGIPQAAFDDFTLRGFGSEHATSFSGGSSDCDYSS